MSRVEWTFGASEQAPGAARGFSLVEVLIAALIFAVGMIAVTGMLYTALGGVANARNMTQATKFGNRLLNLMELESQNWRDGAGSRNLDFPYSEDLDGDGDDEAPTGTDDSLLELANQTPFETWRGVFSEPLNAHLGTGVGPKYCAYVRGETFGSGGLAGGSVQRVQLAVVYPGTGVNFGGDCPDLGDDLDPETDGATEAEESGWRVVYMGGVFQQRSHLD